MRTFQPVDYKIAEAEFFLKRIPESGFNFFAVRSYVSAFVSSMRSVTFTVQSSLHGTQGFDEWYKMWQIKLKNDPLTNFFNKFRRVNQHLGENPIGSGETGQGGVMKCYFTKTPELKNVPSLDVETACRQYFLSILSLVYDCYIKFGRYIDAYQYYTEEHFKSIGKNIEDAEEELGFPRGWTDIGDPSAIPYRWQSLRDNVVGCEINHIFEQYLNKYISYPERLPNL